ncbi:MAG: hypothetical protein LAT84_14435 [Balneolia bacterium]|nr:hypothetical protein [Balneolia bacterium]
MEQIQIIQEIVHGDLHPLRISSRNRYLLKEAASEKRMTDNELLTALMPGYQPESYDLPLLFRDTGWSPDPPLEHELGLDVLFTPVFIRPRLLKPWNIETTGWNMLLRQGAAEAVYGWTKLLENRFAPRFLFAATTYYESLCTALKFTHTELLAEWPFTRAWDELFSDEALTALERLEKEQAAECFVLAQLRQYLISVLSAAFEMSRFVQAADAQDPDAPSSAMPLCYAPEELFMLLLETTPPTELPMHLSRVRGQSDDSCGIPGCSHNYVDVNDGLKDYNRALGLSVRKNKLESILKHEGYPVIELNHKQHSVKECYIKIITAKTKADVY